MNKRIRILLTVSCAAVLVGAGLLIRWGETTGHTPNFGDLPTWIAGVAAAVGLPAVLFQFNAQRRQLAEQQKTIADEFARQKKRDALLDEQLAQVQAVNRVLIRQQAELVDLKFDVEPIVVLDTGAPKVVGNLHRARVANNSTRPIRDVCCQLRRDASAPSESARRVGSYDHNVGTRNAVEGDSARLIRPQEEVAFIFEATCEDAPDAVMSVTFTDDANSAWTIDPDLHLEPLRGEHEAPSPGRGQHDR